MKNFWIFKIGFILIFLLFIPAIFLEKQELFATKLQPDAYVIHTWNHKNKMYQIWCIDGYKYLESDSITPMFEIFGDKSFPARCKRRNIGD